MAPEFFISVMPIAICLRIVFVVMFRGSSILEKGRLQSLVGRFHVRMQMLCPRLNAP